MRAFTKYCIGAFILLLALACNRESRPEAILDGTGSLVLNIGSSTKAGTAADGDKMNNLHVWVTDKSNKVVRYASWRGSDNNLVTMDASHAAATVSISNINRGEYNIYIIANAPSSFTFPVVGETIGDSFKKFVLKLPDGSKVPDFGTGGMPLTLISSVAISPGKNVLNAELVRVCGRLRVSVRNHTTSKNIFLQSVKLGARNPDRGYLFQQDGHAVPDGNTGEFVSINNADEATVTSYIKPGIMETVIDQYIFETGLDAVSNMSLSFSGGIFGDTVKEAVVQASQMDVYSPGAEFAGFYKSNIEAADADYFIIRNCGANYFLRSNGSSMKQFFFNTVDELLASDGVERFFWTFDGASPLTSGTGPSKVKGIQSVSEKKYINISTTVNDALVTLSDKQSLIIGTQSLGMLIRNDDGPYKVYCSYTTGDDVKSKINQADQNLVYWKMIPVKKDQEDVFKFEGAEKDFHKNVSSIDYIDEFGVSVPLTHICRNEDVNIIINVFYNPEYASVYFEVSAWTEISNETTFD